MVSLAEFLSPEAGQRRRAWLDNKGQQAIGTLQYYLGPGVNVGGMVSLADMLNPVADIQRAGTAARGAVQPGRTASERAGYVGSALTDTASVLAPVAGAAYADDAARGLTEGLANLTMPADDMAARFFVDEDGAIRAWHGSPHDFDRFSMDKIGTGEGAQAYGHGLYFAERRGVAEDYRRRLASFNETAEEGVTTVMRYAGGDRAKAAELAKNGLAAVMRDNLDDGGKQVAKWQEIVRLIEDPNVDVTQFKPPGRLYEVNIDANPEDFLDWDAPLSAQPESVRQILEPLLPNPDAIPADEWGVSLARARAMQFPQNPTGGDFIRQIPELTGEDLERSLREAGIPGIRYLDAGSRGAGDGSRNYVVFDDSLITILKKYGLAGVMAGGAYSGMEDSADAGY